MKLEVLLKLIAAMPCEKRFDMGSYRAFLDKASTEMMQLSPDISMRVQQSNSSFYTRFYITLRIFLFD
jgi:hypothetical protein